ncbi:MAG: hypothetical protein LBV33_06205 [Lachnospiraceae bacterium]|jgi:hypothetical protein|nr:hypothetical protein [Lachnospiraceae bacterium]
MKEREGVLELCRKIINDSKEIIGNDENHEMIRKVAELINNRAMEINDICSIEKYNLFFNGTVGEGKTSAISSMFNLLDKDAKKKQEITLLKTSPGRTTPCETEIVQSDSETSIITIVRLDEEEFKNILKDYCHHFYDKKITLPEECSRIIDNMLELKLSDTQEEKLKCLIERFKPEEDSAEAIFRCSIEFIGHKNRNTNEIDLKTNNLKNNLKKTLSDIGSGKRRDCPYPQKIIISIAKKDWILNIPSFIDKVVDTKGIDSPERKDIQDAMKERKNIIIMCDNVKAIAGNENVLSIMRTVLIKENRDDLNRTFYLGLEQGKQLSDADEEKNDRFDGMKIKKTQCLNKLQSNNINFNEKNILFFNAFKGIEIVNDSDISTFNEEENANEVNRLLKDLYDGLERMYLAYSDELSELLKNINSLKQNKISDKTFANFAKVQAIVNDLKDKIKQEYDIINYIGADIDNRHAGIVRAMVNRYGSYEGCNIYEISEKRGGEEFATIVLRSKEELIGSIKGIFIDNDEIEDICMKTLISKIESEYLLAYRKNQKFYYKRVNLIMNKTTPWEKPRTYWGDGGENYRKRVVKDIEEYLKARLVKPSEICENFFKCISDFLIF